RTVLGMFKQPPSQTSNSTGPPSRIVVRERPEDDRLRRAPPVEGHPPAQPAAQGRTVVLRQVAVVQRHAQKLAQVRRGRQPPRPRAPAAGPPAAQPPHPPPPRPPPRVPPPPPRPAGTPPGPAPPIDSSDARPSAPARPGRPAACAPGPGASGWPPAATAPAPR